MAEPVKMRWRDRCRFVCAIGEKWVDGIKGALRSLGATGGVDAATLELAAARAAAGDASVEYDEPVDLAGYDRAFELLEGGAASA